MFLSAAETTQRAHGLVEHSRDLFRSNAERCAAFWINPYRHFARRTARGNDLADPGHGRDARLNLRVDEIAKGITVLAARDLNDHCEAADRSKVLQRNADYRSLRLRAGELGRNVTELELSHPDVRSPLEPESEPPASAVDLAPRLGNPGQLSDTRLERQQDLALDDVRLGARARERYEQLIASQRGEQFDRNPLPGEEPEQH
jgi:hypothetical protein